MPMKRTTDIRRVSVVEGEASPVVAFEGTLTLDRADDAPVTLDDLPGLLAAAMTESSIPGTAEVTQTVEIRIRY